MLSSIEDDYNFYDDSIWGTFLRDKRANQTHDVVKNQEYYDNIFDGIDTKYIENYLRRKKMKNINK